jgi:nucleoside-diphosphate-sugar epimerase
MVMTALILGATGGFGSEIAKALGTAGWQVRAMHRDPESVTKTGYTPPNTQWVKGDALNAEDVLRAAKGVRAIVHAVNPPGYKDWEGKAVPMLENTIAAAHAEDARILLPGNIYAYGDDAGTLLSESSPQHPPTRKGKVRLRMEQRLEAAAGEGVRTIILRAGDFFGPHAPAGWLAGAMAKPGKPVGRVAYPGEPGVGHSWAYLPDLAQSAAALLECEADLPDFDSYHFEGHYLPEGERFAEIVCEVAGRGRVTALPWLLVRMAGLFNETMREIVEMRYLWQTPHRLDGSKLRALMGEEPRTPLVQAIRESLDGMDCLDAGPIPQATRRPAATGG